jgi:hypothetical protein
MPVEIKIFHDTAFGTLAELRELSVGLLGAGPQHAPPYDGPVELVAGPALPVDAAPAPAATEPAKRRGRPPKNDTTPAPIEGPAPVPEMKPGPSISVSPEDRVNPDDVAGDEAEEADGIEEMNDAPGAKLTVDDLRNAAGRINRALGNNPARAQELAAPAFVEHGVKSISTCPDDKLETMIAALNAVAAKVEAGEVK